MTIEKHYSYMVDALRDAQAMYEGLLRGVTQDQARASRGGDEHWSVVEVVCHLRDNEERRLERIRLIRTEDNPVLPSYDQAQLAKERKYAEDNMREALAAFFAARAKLIDVLTALPPAEWERAGQHREMGRMTIGDQVLRAVCHDVVHAAQIARQLGQ